MASASTAGDGSDSEEGIGEDVDDEPFSMDEGENWVTIKYFTDEDI